MHYLLLLISKRALLVARVHRLQVLAWSAPLLPRHYHHHLFPAYSQSLQEFVARCAIAPKLDTPRPAPLIKQCYTPIFMNAHVPQLRPNQCARVHVRLTGHFSVRLPHLCCCATQTHSLQRLFLPSAPQKFYTHCATSLSTGQTVPRISLE